MERDAANFQTNREILMYGGGLYDGTWLSIVLSVLRISLICLGIFQYIMTLVMSDGSHSIIQLMEAMHWAAVFSFVVIVIGSLRINSSLFFKLEAVVKSGFYDYGGNLTEEQIMVRANHNKDVQIFTNVFATFCFLSLLTTYLKAPMFMERWAMPYPIWIPFKVNSWFRYFAAMLEVWLISEPMPFCACSNCVAFVALIQPLIAQFRILYLAIKEIDTMLLQEGTPEEIEKRLLLRIKQCCEHHIVLIDYFGDLQRYFNTTLLVAAFGTALYLCTVGYILISPEATLFLVAPLLIVLVAEVIFTAIYCVLGQRTVDVAEEVGEAICNLDWYTMPLAVQKDLMMILVGCKKPRQLTGMGLHEFSLKGLSEICQASFTCFNMLLVLSGD